MSNPSSEEVQMASDPATALASRPPKGNKDILDAMMNAEWCSRTGRFAEKQGKTNIVTF